LDKKYIVKKEKCIVRLGVQRYTLGNTWGQFTENNVCNEATDKLQNMRPTIEKTTDLQDPTPQRNNNIIYNNTIIWHVNKDSTLQTHENFLNKS
jgi:hypothetical protein